MGKENSKDIKFEAALSKLEDIVGKLEDGDLDLEKALELFAEGSKMASLCQKKLGEAEKKIEKLVRDRDGSLTTESIDDPTDNSPA